MRRIIAVINTFYCNIIGSSSASPSPLPAPTQLSLSLCLPKHICHCSHSLSLSLSDFAGIFRLCGQKVKNGKARKNLPPFHLPSPPPPLHCVELPSMSVFYGVPRPVRLPAHAATLVVADKWRGQSKLFIIVITAGGKRGKKRGAARGGRQEVGQRQ